MHACLLDGAEPTTISGQLVAHREQIIWIPVDERRHRQRLAQTRLHIDLDAQWLQA
jgi:hypothetical protein